MFHMKHSWLSTAHTLKNVRYLGVGEEVPPLRKGSAMIRIDGVLMTKAQFEVLLYALEHQVEVEETLEIEGDPTDAQALFWMFRNMGRIQGLDL